MKFLFPTFLFALFTIIIPILIHLFSFRRFKTVYFSNVGFLKDIKKESKKKSRLKQILMLIARILTLIFLVFAFSQPYIPVNKDVQNQSNQVVAVYIDNSFSMNALSEKGQLLEVARNKALEICLAYPAGTKFRIFTNDLEPKHQNLLNKEQFIQQVAEIKSSPAVIPISLIYNRFAIQQLDKEPADKNLYVISDFQRSISDFENFSDELIFSYYLPLIPNEVANLYIDSCWVDVPAHRLNQEEELFVKIKNSSDQNYQNLPLKLYLNDSIKSITNFSVDAQSEIVSSLKYTNNAAGTQLGNIEIIDYPFTHDNNWYISYFVEPKLKALAISDNSESSVQGMEYINALFENDDYVQLDNMNMQSLQISKLGEYHTIFLVNQENISSGLLSELHNVVQNGTSVVLFPGTKNNVLSNNKFLSLFNANNIINLDSTNQKISGVDFENKFYRDVFKKREENPILPEINGHLRFESNIRSSERNLLWFQNGDKALSVSNFEKGKVWVFSFPLEFKNESFAKDVLFVPTLYNIVLSSVSQGNLALTVGKDNSYILRGRKSINPGSNIEMENTTNGQRFIPGKTESVRSIKIDFTDQISIAGHYKILNNNQAFSTLAFNYNRQESDLSYLSETELKNSFETAQLKNASVVSDIESNFSEIFDEINKGRQLWKLCIILALFFVSVEILIARFWK